MFMNINKKKKKTAKIRVLGWGSTCRDFKNFLIKNKITLHQQNIEIK